MRKASHHQSGAKSGGDNFASIRSASAVAHPGPRMHTGGAGGRHHRTGAFPTPLLPAARGRAAQLRTDRRGAPAPMSRPGSRLPSHPTPPVGNAGVKEENR